MGMTNNAGKVSFVKKIMCCLLVVWLALFSGGANAHPAQDAVHDSSAMHNHAAHSMQIPVVAGNSASAASAADTAPDANHAEVCSQSHCGHGHSAGLLTPHNAFVKVRETRCVPASPVQWSSSPIASNIDRPKCLLTTSTVVSLLS